MANKKSMKQKSDAKKAHIRAISSPGGKPQAGPKKKPK